MAYRWILSWFVAVLFSATVSGSALAASDLVEKVQVHLYAGQAADAASVAEARLAEAPEDDQARFALGAVQFLQAVEHLGQALHRYGLGSGAYNTGFGLMALPVLRIPVPKNPNPEELTYDSLRGVLDAFVTDLQAAEETLGKIKDQRIDLPLNIGLIRLDLNGDGQGSDDEALWLTFNIVAAAGWLDEAAAGKLLIDFDGSDAPWLQAYCHLLMAIAEFPLAHDWHEAFQVTFPTLFDMPSSPYRKLDQAYSETRDADVAGGLMERAESAAIADLIAFLHLNHWPVVEPERMANVLEHLEAMVRLGRENWKRILAESDNRAEWIPNPSQTGVLPRMQVTQRQVDGWQNFLDEFEAILQGKKLLPHWRFDEGINMRRFFLEPGTFDIVLLIQGSAALPYLEEGELTTGETWVQIMQLFGGDFFRYFIWFN
jgi:hypothetical protein